jgi:hypothetical protein
MKKGLVKTFLFSIICFSQLVTVQDLTEEKPQESTEALTKIGKPYFQLNECHFSK